MRVYAPLVLVPLGAFLISAVGRADTGKLSDEQKVDLLRGLTAEYAIAKVVLPRSDKALPIGGDGTRDAKKWEDALYKKGPAARAGDMVQITKVKIDDKKITLEINDGSKKGSFWDRVTIGTGNVQRPVTAPKTSAQLGTVIELNLDEGLGELDAAAVKKLLNATLDFEKHSATETYVETLPEPIQEAIKAEKAIAGMDREMVTLALGRPRDKVRDSTPEIDYETWIYGTPPGVMTFVKFAGEKVETVYESFAGLGGSIAHIPGPEH